MALPIPLRCAAVRSIALTWLLLPILAQVSSGAGVGAIQDGAQESPQAQDGPVVQAVELEGLRSYNRDGVLRALGIAVGRPYPSQSAQRAGVQRAWETYRIIIGEPVIEQVPGGVRVTIPIQELAVDLDPRFVGNDAVSVKKLREWALLFDREQIYLVEADTIRNRLIQGYRRRGHNFVEIDVVTGGETEEGGAATDVIFEIREGPRLRVRKIVVEGNESLPDTGWGFWRGGLRSLAKVQTKGKGVFRWWGGVYDREVLDADVVAMRQVYRDRGWLDAKVEIAPLELNDERDRVTVRVVVDEGPLWTVGSVRIAAIESDDEGDEQEVDLFFPEQELLELLTLEPDVPYEVSRVQLAHRELQNYYGERGYLPQSYFVEPDAEGFQFLDPDVVYDWDSKTIAVTLRIRQGRQRFIREVQVSGNLHTDDSVVRREVDALPGQRADIKKIARSLSRIRGTGYFDDRMDPLHADPSFRFKTVPGDPDLIDIVYAVEEGRVVDFNISGGVASDSGLVGLLSLNMRNFAAADLPSGFWATPGEIYRKEAFHGNGETFGIDLSPGSEVSYWRVVYGHPDLFGSHFDRYAGRMEFLSRDRRYTSHDEDRTTGKLTIARLFGQGDFSVRVGPRWLNVDIHDLDENDDLPSTLVASEGKSDFVGISVELRYNQLDNRIRPSEGYYLSWANTVYDEALGGDNDVWQSELNADLYVLAGDESADIRSGFYFGGAVGVAHPYGDTDFVNYAERYFLGGSATLRGFDFRGVGPNDGDYSLGGETFVRGTAEYRYPIYSTPVPGTSRRQEMLRLTLFLDAGILDPDSFEMDFDEYRSSAGFGFGLVQPIPLSFNFGFPLQTGEGDDEEVFSFRLDFR